MPPDEGEPGYNVKYITYLGRRTPIVLQDENGPCPLIAIANVLLLRGQVSLPAGVGEVSQVRGDESPLQHTTHWQHPPPPAAPLLPCSSVPLRSPSPTASPSFACRRRGWRRWWRDGCWTRRAWRGGAG